MNFQSILIWGFAATCVLTSLIILARAMHLTRMDIPFVLGTLFTADRDRAKWFGTLAHFFMGWIFAFIYALAFEDTGLKTTWFGMLIGLVHGVTVLTVGMNIVSHIHPRMATDERGPEPTRLLEPPGFLILNYGHGTPLTTLTVHVIYGGILGTFYT